MSWPRTRMLFRVVALATGHDARARRAGRRSGPSSSALPTPAVAAWRPARRHRAPSARRARSSSRRATTSTSWSSRTGGVVSLRPVLAALRAGKVVATANKETLVAGGHLVMPEARRLAAERGAAAAHGPVREPAGLAPPDRFGALGHLAVPRRRIDGGGRRPGAHRVRRAVPRRHAPRSWPRSRRSRRSSTRPGPWAPRSRSTRRRSPTRAWRSSRRTGCTMSTTTRSRWSSTRRASSTPPSASSTAPSRPSWAPRICDSPSSTP